ncbi:hypothetical protein DVH24_019953 [Malus domestica]|uniref:Uncharacterized protein n=1 Tax=Malus domestica TaxID=3750 RepID=A0A498I4P6_MALDO|nr:hypothetical protein DVH24_019953 [Malus domestica]
MTSTSMTSKLPKISPYNLFINESPQSRRSHLDILNQCKVWWEPGQEVYVDLLALSDPQCLVPEFTHGILISYDMAICNLTLVAFKLFTCFELLNQWFRAELGL